jgi:hypothetical protein
MFEVPPGSYSVRPTKSGASFSPDVVNLNNLSADKIQDFACPSGCTPSPSIVGAKELVISHPSVLNDSRASNATNGPWSFRFLMEQMAPLGMDPADFVEAWLNEFTSPPPPNQKTVNGFPVDNRFISVPLLFWPRLPNGKLDLAQSPFRLLAIVNRTDLHKTSNGEGRFVFGFFEPSAGGRPFTVIFEYGLPAVDPVTQQPLTRKSWVNKFHTLASKTFGTDYNPALQAVTDLFTRRNTSPSRPNGSSVNQVRSNEIFMSQFTTVWQAREFHLSAGLSGGLKLGTTANTPDDSAHLAGTPTNLALTNYLNTEGTKIRVGYASVPPGIIGGQSTENFIWDTFAAPVDPNVRRAFAGATCSGCHFSENFNLNIGGFYLIQPFGEMGPDGTGHLSNFVKQIEIPRRAMFAQNLMSCTGSSCSPGAEALLKP